MLSDILSLTKRLMIIKSVKDNPHALHEVLNSAKNELVGFTTEIFEKDGVPSLLAYVGPKRPDRFKLILNAHLDVVPASENYYTPQEKHGRLYGRGTSDMKAAAAVEIILFKQLAHTLTYPIGLQLVTDEEVGGFKGVKYQIEQKVLADFVLAGEPTDLGINNKAKGIIWANVRTTGTAAHGAYPWNGVNAISKMYKIISQIEREFPVPDKETWKTTVNIAKIETSNDTYNKVPDDCILKLDIRYIPEDTDTIKSQIDNLVKGCGEIEYVLIEPAQFTNEKDRFVQSLKKSIKSITGQEAEIIVKHGGADIRHYNKVGCEGVTFGPVGAGLHTDNEWIDINGLQQYYNILKDFLISLV